MKMGDNSEVFKDGYRKIGEILIYIAPMELSR